MLIREIPEAREVGLAQLCEFIEDCEFTFLSVQILHLLGEEGPSTKEPGALLAGPPPLSGRCAARAAAGLPWPSMHKAHTHTCTHARPPTLHTFTHARPPTLPPSNPPPTARYIRYIYNRVILENATVRAAALSSLARFGAACPELHDRVVLLLKRALYDNDDEVRGWRASWLTGGLRGWRAGLGDCACGGEEPRGAVRSLPLPAGRGRRVCTDRPPPPHPHACPPPSPYLPCPARQVRDRATLYLYQLTRAPAGPASVDPAWRIPAKGLEVALAGYLAQADTEEPFDLVRVSLKCWLVAAGGAKAA